MVWFLIFANLFTLGKLWDKNWVLFWVFDIFFSSFNFWARFGLNFRGAVIYWFKNNNGRILRINEVLGDIFFDVNPLMRSEISARHVSLWIILISLKVPTHLCCSLSLPRAVPVRAFEDALRGPLIVGLARKSTRGVNTFEILLSCVHVC